MAGTLALCAYMYISLEYALEMSVLGQGMNKLISCVCVCNPAV